MLGQHCVGVLSSQCCPNTAEPTLHTKKYVCNVGPECTDKFFQENWLEF